MKNITEYINESAFDTEACNEILALIASVFNAELSTNDFGISKMKYSFNVDLSLTGISEKTGGRLHKADTTDIIQRSIGQIVEAAIKYALPEEFTINDETYKVEYQDAKSPYDLLIKTSNSNVKLEIKAVKSNDIKRMKDSVTISKEERAAADYLLVVEYSLSGNNVEVKNMYLTDTAIAPLTGKHWTKAQIEAAVKFGE